MACHWFFPLLICAALPLASLFYSNESVAQPVVLESALMGTPGRFGGTSITTSQYVGWRFATNQTLAVDHIGGHLLSIPDQPGDIFAALVRLQSIDSVPMGAPFTPEEVVATTTFQPPFPSAEVFTPLSTTLTPGSYTLVFGTGLFGATGSGAIYNGDDQPDIPPTNLSSFIFWSSPFAGQPPEWRLNLASHMRFVIEAQVVIPGDYNNDGTVDAADYIVWRKGLGTTYRQSDYDVWRANFGQTAGSGAGAVANVAVPEPASIALLIMGSLATCFRRRGQVVP